MHIINPSTAAGSRETLTRHPVVKGERAAAGHVGEKGRKDTGIYKACDREELNPRLLALLSSTMSVIPLSVMCSKKQKTKMQSLAMWKTQILFLFLTLHSGLPLK